MPKPDDFFASLAGNRRPSCCKLLPERHSLCSAWWWTSSSSSSWEFTGRSTNPFRAALAFAFAGRRRRAAREVWEAVEIELGAYVRSEAIQSIAAGLLLWTGYRLLGQPYPVLLAIAGAVAWLIPWVGVLLAVGAVALASVPVLLLDPQAAVRSVVPSVLYTSAVLLVLQRFVEPGFLTARIQRPGYGHHYLRHGQRRRRDGPGVGAPLAAALQIAGRHWMRWRMMAISERANQDSFGERLLELRASLERENGPAGARQLGRSVGVARGRGRRGAPTTRSSAAIIRLQVKRGREKRPGQWRIFPPRRRRPRKLEFPTEKI